MSTRSPVKSVTRAGRRHLILDFSYTDKKGRRRRYRRDAHVQTRTAARAEAERLMDLAARTGSPFAERNVPTFGEFVAKYFGPVFMPRLRPGTKQRYQSLLTQGLLEHFGRTRLDDITFASVLAFAAMLQQRERVRPLRGSTHGITPRGPVNLLRAVLRAAVQARVLVAIPELPRFPEAPKLPAAPGREHVAAMLEGLKGWLRTAVALQALAGLRQGEMRTLQAGDVDVPNNVIHVRRAASEDAVVMPKGNRQRVVPMLPELADILREATRGKLPRALVVTDEKGEPVRRQAYLARLKAFERRAGLEQWSSHALRHYFCSELTRSGANLEAVRALAGHSNVGTTQRYLHATGAGSCLLMVGSGS